MQLLLVDNDMVKSRHRLRTWLLPTILLTVILMQQRELRGSGSSRHGEASRRSLAQGQQGWLHSLREHEGSTYSQNGEDGILETIFSKLGTTNKYYVEFGTESGQQCNTRLLRESGWTGLLMDGSYENASINLYKETITPANINSLFAKHGVPADFDLLSIDVDYDDYWVWRNTSSFFRPRVVVVEYNAGIPVEKRWVVNPADPARWTQTNYYGASARALADLGKRKGYTLVAADAAGVNLFFVRTDLLAAQGLSGPDLLDVHVGRVHHARNLDKEREWLELDEQGEVVGRLYNDLGSAYR